jgi:hypothetical protein
LPKYTSAPGAAAARSPSAGVAEASERAAADASTASSASSARAGETSRLDSVAANAAPNTARREARGRAASAGGGDAARVWTSARRAGAARVGANERACTTDVIGARLGVMTRTYLRFHFFAMRWHGTHHSCALPCPSGLRQSARLLSGLVRSWGIFQESSWTI